jgi:hypothetical protein
MVLIRLNRDEIPKKARHVSLDAFVEFTSKGCTGCVVPQIYPRMSEIRLTRAMCERQALSESTDLAAILDRLAAQLRDHVMEIRNRDLALILRYQHWCESGGITK